MIRFPHRLCPPKLHRPANGWLIILPSLCIIGLMLVLTPSTSANQAPSTLTGVLAPSLQQPVCQNCHPEQYAAWKGTPHALAAGASCEDCHGPYKEGHPDQTTMKLPMASDTCQTCHGPTFAEWTGSAHAAKNIECFDCHNAHTQGLRTGSEEKLCGACHSERQTQVKHATHGINGVDCANCHMAPEQAAGTKAGQAKPTEGTVRSHNFKATGDVCAKCHESSIHTSNTLVSLRNPDAAGMQPETDRTAELQQQVSGLQSRIDSMRSSAAMTMGLAFGVGGFLGLLAGVAGMTFWQRRNS